MAYYGNDVIAVSTKGAAETDFVSASFEARVVTEGTTGPDAKEKAISVIEKIKKAISMHADKGGIDTKRLKTTFAVDIRHDRITGGFAGYKATYTIKFTGKNVAAATDIHDALTSIESVQAPTPIFNIDDSSDIHARAFTDAVQKAKIKFKDQCVALALEYENFSIQSWTAGEEEHHGKTLGLTEDSGPKPGIEPGKASLDMRVTLVYRKK